MGRRGPKPGTGGRPLKPGYPEEKRRYFRESKERRQFNRVKFRLLLKSWITANRLIESFSKEEDRTLKCIAEFADLTEIDGKVQAMFRMNCEDLHRLTEEYGILDTETLEYVKVPEEIKKLAQEQLEMIYDEIDQIVRGIRNGEIFHWLLVEFPLEKWLKSHQKHDRMVTQKNE